MKKFAWAESAAGAQGHRLANRNFRARPVRVRQESSPRQRLKKFLGKFYKS